MRIWHLMVAVLVSGVILALLAQTPMFGLLALLDVLTVSCAQLLLRYERRAQVLWFRASRPGDPPRRLGERLSRWGGGLMVILYQAIGVLVITMAASLVLITACILVFVTACKIVDAFAILRRGHGL